MIRTYPATVERLYAAPYSNRRGAQAAEYYRKVGRRILLPETNIDWTWYGASDIVVEFAISAEFQFSLFDITKSDEYCACVSWITDGSTVHRYKLWQDVGEILYAPLYKGEYIGQDFLIEIWNTQLPHWGDTSSYDISSFYLYSSNLILQLGCPCSDSPTFTASNSEIDDNSPVIVIQQDKTFPLMPLDDSCCGFDFAIQTTDATKTLVVKFAINSSQVTEVTVRGAGQSSDLVVNGAYRIERSFINTGGVTSVSADIIDRKAGTADTGAVLLETDGVNVVCSVVGVVGKTVNWAIRILPYPNFNPNPNILPPPGPSPILANLVAYYKCDETGGSLLDSTGNHTLLKQDVTLSGTTIGVVNGARSFAATVPDYFGVVDAGHTALRFGPKDRTVTMWVKVTTLGAVQTLLWKNHEVLITIAADGHVVFTMLKADNTVAATVTSTIVLTAGTYAFIVCKYILSTTSVSIQLNMGAINSSVQTAVPGNGATANMLQLGAQGGSVAFTGAIDEIAIVDANLTSDELNDMYAPTSYPF